MPDLALLARLIPEKLKLRGIEPPVAPPSPYAGSFFLFLRDCVWTIDKARAGEERPWPCDGAWEAYWRDWEEALLCGGPLLVDKTRRTMASNVICAFDLWIASGGTDARWPSLLRSQKNRSVLIQAQKLGKSKHDEGCSSEFVSRIEAMVRVMEDHGLRERWPGFPTWTWGFGVGVNSLGGKILAVPEGPDQVRGPGTTLLHAEEVGAWEQAQATLEQALPALHPEGHVVAVTTPVVDSYVARIVGGEIQTGRGGALVLPATGRLPLYQAGDWAVLEVRGERDIPGYDPAQVGRGMSPQTFRREVLGDWTASTGKLVFPEYGDMHESPAALPYDPKRPLLCGWDLPAATGGTPAFVVTQLTHGGQWLLFGSVLPGVDETIGVWDFAERCAYYLKQEFADPAGLRVEDLNLVHYGDPAGAQRPLLGGGAATEIGSAYEIIRDGERFAGPNGTTIERPGFGWDIQPGEVSLVKRLEVVRTRLCANVGGAPSILVDPGATFIRAGFKGGYHYAQRNDGRYELDPAKNRYSHVFDALEYVCSRTFLHRISEDRLGDYLRRVQAEAPQGRIAGSRGR